MSRGFLCWTAGIAALICLAGLAGADLALAQWVHASGLHNWGIWDWPIDALDTATAKELTHNRSGAIVAVVGVAWWALRRDSPAAKLFVLTGVSSFLTSQAVGVLKTVFGRLRPGQFFDGADWNHLWHVGGSAFPSGHAGFYFGLLLPVAAAVPRARWLLAIPIFVACARIGNDAHWLSDVAASVVIAAGFGLIASGVHARWVGPENALHK